MASLNNGPRGDKRIQFTDGDGRRKTLYLGRLDNKSASIIQTKIEGIHAAKLGGYAVDRHTAQWLNDIGGSLHAKLVKLGLVEPRPEDEQDHVSLKAWLDQFFKLLDVKPSTMTTYQQTRRVLEAYFKADRRIDGITPTEADHWRAWMKDAGLAQATIARRVKTARQIFRKAVKRKLIAENPFEDVRAGSMVNAKRGYFVSRREADRVLQACPDAQWRLLFALSRYGGLRIPSEPLAIRWSDVLWDQDKIHVFMKKKENEANGEKFVPIFPELRGPLMEAYEQAEPGAEYIITRYRDSAVNLRTQLLRIIRRAGVRPWPRIWHNMRATRITELLENNALHLVCAWLGVSAQVAMKHYAMVRGEDYAKAAGKNVTQNATYYSAGMLGNEGEGGIASKPKTPILPKKSAYCPRLPEQTLTPTGFEPVLPP